MILRGGSTQNHWEPLGTHWGTLGTKFFSPTLEPPANHKFFESPKELFFFNSEKKKKFFWEPKKLVFLKGAPDKKSHPVDGVGPVDNRPFTDELHHFVRKNVICDT